MMASMVEVSAQTRSGISRKILDQMNKVGQDNVITVVMDEGGKLARNSRLAIIKAYIYYKD